jgi:hypothetical protein
MLSKWITQLAITIFLLILFINFGNGQDYVTIGLTIEGDTWNIIIPEETIGLSYLGGDGTFPVGTYTGETSGITVENTFDWELQARDDNQGDGKLYYGSQPLQSALSIGYMVGGEGVLSNAWVEGVLPLSSGPAFSDPGGYLGFEQEVLSTDSAGEYTKTLTFVIVPHTIIG